MKNTQEIVADYAFIEYGRDNRSFSIAYSTFGGKLFSVTILHPSCKPAETFYFAEKLASEVK